MLEKPRRMIPVIGGHVLLGGIPYWVDGEQKQAAAFIPEGSNLEEKISQLIELEKKHGVWKSNESEKSS